MENSDEHRKSNEKKFSSLSKRRIIKVDANISSEASTVGESCRPSQYLPGIFGIQAQENSHNSYNIVVYYKCSKEISNVSNLQSSSLDTLKNCVLDLKKENKDSSTLVLLTIQEKGVRIFSSLDNEIITYPLQSIIFSAVCAEDRNYFGLVTKKSVSNTHLTKLRSSNSPYNCHSFSSFCHVFLMDSKLYSSEKHVTVASRFNFTPTSVQIPKSSSDILKELNSFYDEKKPQVIKDASKISSHHQAALEKSSLCIGQTKKDSVISRNSSHLKGQSEFFTPERIPRDVEKLMISPPSSLTGINDEEREEILQELKNSDKKLWNKDKAVTKGADANGVEEGPPKGRLVRRKSAPEVEQLAHKTDTIKRTLFSNQFTQSLKFDSRKPPVPSKNSQIIGTDPSFFKNGLGFFRRNFRRKSEIASRRNNLVESGKFGKCDTPQIHSFSGSRCDTNENLKRLSLNSTSSEISLNEIQSKVEGWAQSFEKLLSDPIGVRCFQEFLKKEFSEENVLFWVQCEKYKRTKDVQTMKSLARDIFKIYISPNAPSLVNVNQSAVKDVEENLHSPHRDMFTKAQDQVYNLMKFDSYNRFLKSDIYKECTDAEINGKLFPFEDEIDEEFRNKRLWGKKRPSESSLDWKKNIANFLGKSGRVEKSDEEKSNKDYNGYEPFDEKNILASPDVVPEGDGIQLWDGLHSNSKGNFLRVILPDGTSTVVVGESGKTLKDSLQDICRKRNISLSTFDVAIGGSKEITSLGKDISTLSDSVIYLERRILFRFDLPNGRSVGVKANPSKTLAAILQPVMRKNGFNLDNYSVHVMNTKSALALDSSISVAENKRLVTRLLHKKLEKQTSDSAAMKQGSDIRSSFRRFRTNSFKEEKFRTDKQSNNSTEKYSDIPRIYNSEKIKHSLLGRTKSNDEDGASALMSVLQRSQSGRLDDQRGISINDLEIPEFLKVTCSTPLIPRIKSVSTGSGKTSMPGNYIGKYPASPVIVEKHFNFLEFEDNQESRLNSSLNSGGGGGFYSVTSWKEIESPDRELIDNKFSSEGCFDTVGEKNMTKENKNYLTEISKSQPYLAHSKVPSPTPLLQQKTNSYNSNTNVQGATKFPLLDDVRLNGKEYEIRQHQEILRNSKAIPKHDRTQKSSSCVSEKLEISKKPEISTRPKCITNYCEKEVLVGLEADEYEIISSIETKMRNEPDDDALVEIYQEKQVSKSESLPKSKYNPKKTQNAAEFTADKDSVFQVNAVPTPEKGRLLRGETVLSRKNEKITFV